MTLTVEQQKDSLEKRKEYQKNYQKSYQKEYSKRPYVKEYRKDYYKTYWLPDEKKEPKIFPIISRRVMANRG